jgi:hypothetical protein
MSTETPSQPISDEILREARRQIASKAGRAFWANQTPEQKQRHIAKLQKQAIAARRAAARLKHGPQWRPKKKAA